MMRGVSKPNEMLRYRLPSVIEATEVKASTSSNGTSQGKSGRLRRQQRPLPEAAPGRNGSPGAREAARGVARVVAGEAAKARTSTCLTKRGKAEGVAEDDDGDDRQTFPGCTIGASEAVEAIS
mmetsp:Transcript_57068/g.107521  ORF Transcript_57068/g.107521 Transcript_57068/m.107521 type:complete len:123 (-) Transcript_57068:116-484(-)